MLVWLGSGEGSFLGCRPLTPHMLEGAREFFWISFMSALIPFTGALSSSPNPLPKTPPSHSITLGVRISTGKFGGHSNFQSLTNALTNLDFCDISDLICCPCPLPHSVPCTSCRLLNTLRKAPHPALAFPVPSARNAFALPPVCLTLSSSLCLFSSAISAGMPSPTSPHSILVNPPSLSFSIPYLM